MRPLSVAPMMDRTDRHFRYFLRQISRRTLLYTEMITTGALLRGERAAHLDFSEEERPVALQLGGDDPAALAACAAMGEDWGYDEINLNCGCPSPRVKRGCFGAALMLEPDRVAEAVAAMRAATRLPVTVKHRIGVDDVDRYEDMARFVSVVAEAGCREFAVHARKAWLNGLSPKANRTVPPLRYGDVHRLKAEFPHLQIAINGGIRSLDEAAAQLAHVDSVMIGRAAVDDPMLFAEADRRFFGEAAPPPTAAQIVAIMLPYVACWSERGVSAAVLLRPLMPLFAGRPGARAWRQALSASHQPSAVTRLREALAVV